MICFLWPDVGEDGNEAICECYFHAVLPVLLLVDGLREGKSGHFFPREALLKLQRVGVLYLKRHACECVKVRCFRCGGGYLRRLVD